jgi:formylglycine-generating enzyme required for sulfatase activity
MSFRRNNWRRRQPREGRARLRVLSEDAQPLGRTLCHGSVARANEIPLHSVNVPPFFLSQFPVTVGEWRRCVVAKACSPAATGKSEFEDLPVHNVSWDDAKQYITWLSQITRKAYRLPAEAEWEFAARANTTSTYWRGDRFVPDRANCHECGLAFEADERTAVGTFVPNAFGLFDMVGSVDQWVADCWHESYKSAPLPIFSTLRPDLTPRFVGRSSV